MDEPDSPDAWAAPAMLVEIRPDIADIHLRGTQKALRVAQVNATAQEQIEQVGVDMTIALLKTRGLDLGATYEFGIEGYGRYRLTVNFERTLSYQRKDNDSAPLLERLDTLNAGGDIFPKFRGNAALDWALDRFNARLALNHISKVSDCDAPDRYAGRPACNNNFGDYRTIDVQFGYDTPWRQSITLGVRNLFNEAPQVSRYIQNAALPGVFLALHDSEQRVLYLRLTQRF